MSKNLVIYYSNKGKNRFIAERISEQLDSDIEAIKPQLDVQLFLMMGLNFGNKVIKTNLSDYERVILVGPVWMGKLIAPLKTFLNKNQSQIKQLVFATCCGSGLEQANKKYGHGLVFNEVKALMKDKVEHCEAFPIGLILPEAEREDPNAMMKTRLNSENFNGEIAERLGTFINKMKEA